MTQRYRYTPEQKADVLQRYWQWKDEPWTPDRPTIEELAKELGVSKPTIYTWNREWEAENRPRDNDDLSDLDPHLLLRLISDVAASEARIKELQRTIEGLEGRILDLETPKPAAKRRR